jgi:hypothetical protein
MVKDVTRPTRKVYMLYDLEPSAEITGGPWYSDNEFDTAFIDAHADAILTFIRGLVCSHFESVFSSSRILIDLNLFQEFPQTTRELFPNALSVLHHQTISIGAQNYGLAQIHCDI